MNLGYSGLFWTDGFSCIVSILIFALLIKEKKKVAEPDAHLLPPNASVFQDKNFLLFLYVSFITALLFFQIFSTLPLYHNEKYGLTELETGLLMTLNGFLIFLVEMPLVGFFERVHYPKLKLVLYGAICMMLGFIAILPEWGSWLLIVNILFLTFGEIFAFPFSNAFVLSRAPKGQMGKYMGFYTMSFSLAHILGAKIGLGIVELGGYQWNWVVMVFLGLSAVVCNVYVMKREFEKEQL